MAHKISVDKIKSEIWEDRKDFLEKLLLIDDNAQKAESLVEKPAPKCLDADHFHSDSKTGKGQSADNFEGFGSKNGRHADTYESGENCKGDHCADTFEGSETDSKNGQTADYFEGGPNNKGEAADKFDLGKQKGNSKGHADHYENTIEGGCRGSLAQIQVC